MEKKEYQYLYTIDSPDDLKQIPRKELPLVCDELRKFIIDEVSRNPGHLGSNLGSVELTVALHYVFNAPYDRIVWDVGHQAYGHKILTGRRDEFHTNRKLGGICGFPSIFESEYDAFGVGHASTSISAGLGMSIASLLKKEKQRRIVAVIGDGSMTGGLAFEGLNNTSMDKNDLLIVLNDNQMAIDPVRGGITQYLVDITTSATYNKFRYCVYKVLRRLGFMSDNAKKKVQLLGNSLKATLTRQSNIFEGLNIRYFGPVDGHDVENLVKVFEQIKDFKGPKVLHCISTKGKGYTPAENAATEWHAPGQFDVESGTRKNASTDPSAPLFQTVFGETLLELARKNDKIVGVTPAMPTGCSMNIMQKVFPERVFDVGIAEAHSVTFSAGLAKEGLIPFCNVYSSFMQRAYDSIIHDVALQKLNVTMCLDRAGLVGSDGATHHGAFDMAYMRCIPNLTIAAPRDEHALRNLMFTVQQNEYGPFVIRYPRGKGFLIDWRNEMEVVDIGKGECLKAGDSKLAVLTIGVMAYPALEAIRSVESKTEAQIGLYDMKFLKPLDTELLASVAANYSQLITVEDGTVNGGFGSAVLEFLADSGYTTRVRRMGIPDQFIEHGTPEELYAQIGLNANGIEDVIVDELANA
jgi:1-deoxy-D-xylulose-5-phosphate synthase